MFKLPKSAFEGWGSSADASTMSSHGGQQPTTAAALEGGQAAGSPLLVPSHILNAFLPGYTIIASSLSSLLGFDVSAIVSVLFFLVTLAAALRFAWTRSYTTIVRLCSYAVVLNPNDPVYDDLMRWVSRQKTIPERARNLRVSTPGSQRDGSHSMYSTQVDDNDEYLFDSSEGDSTDTLFNFAAAQAKKPLRFSPHLGNHPFWHKGQLFILEIYEKKNGNNGNNNSSGSNRNGDLDFEETRLRYFGFSMKPISLLLEELRASNMSHQFTKTSIFRPAAMWHPARNPWKKVTSRASRPLHTVDLGSDDKTRLVRDINNFLKPTSAKWYSARGIPYRRGYLFSGPPGTGKSSISFALAGIFGLSIYAVSLQEGNTSEDELCSMLSILPLRALVLIEDVDAAGLVRDSAPQPEEETSSDDSKDKKGDASKKKKITLSGLLNAIDGVASHEGHILIMTSNYPERLDPALKRPGRIDMHVPFTLASRSQIRDVYLRMYTSAADEGDAGKAETRRATTVEEACKTSGQRAASTNGEHDEGDKQKGEKAGGSGLWCPFMSMEEINKQAELFADKVPEGKFSPAEVQGFLLERLKDPKGAVDAADEWIGKGLAEKEGVEKAKEDEKKTESVGAATEVEAGKGVAEKPLVNGVQKHAEEKSEDTEATSG
ncbi:MAG: hypothetical protein M1828_002097 [Chrysothrix sp. TS-e1954]|nr:MAG: hypothetical protein M1828_002097 [Chrysothrix sp. TS-e1954]